MTSTHLLTSRNKGTADRFLVLLGIFIFGIFGLCSAYAIIITSGSNPAAWSMIVFFGGLLLLLITAEENVFPSLPKQSLAFGAVTWVFSWIFIAFLVSFLITLNPAHLGSAALFGVIVFVSGSLTVRSNLKVKKQAKKKPRPKRRILGY